MDQNRRFRTEILVDTKHPNVREKSDLTLKNTKDIPRRYEIEQKHLKTINIGKDPNVNLIKRKCPNKHQHSQVNPHPRVLKIHIR